MQLLQLCLVVLLLPAIVHVCTATSETCSGGTEKNSGVPLSSSRAGIEHYNIVLMGCTGSLAKKYLWRALFNVFNKRYIKESVHFQIYAAARKDAEEGRREISRLLLALVDCGSEDTLDKECWDQKKRFVEAIQYHRLKTERDFQELAEKLYENSQSIYGIEPGSPVTHERGRLVYMAIPPSTYATTAKYINKYLRPQIGRPWMRVVLEKPFGQDFNSAQALSRELNQYFDESELFRIDHYLGKTAVNSILPFRYMNREIYEPFWNREHIEQVEIVMKEREDVKGRTNFYDDVGVMRDVMQNHMTEMLSLVALDLPDDSSNITSQLQSKLQVLQQIRSDDPSALVAQYSTYNIEWLREEKSKQMSAATLTPTFAAVTLFVDNARWRGVPFILVSGKKLDEKASYVRLLFRNNRFCLRASFSHSNDSSCSRQRQVVFRVGDKLLPSTIAVSRDLPKPKRVPSGWQELTKFDEESSFFTQNMRDLICYISKAESDPYSDLLEAAMDGSRHRFVPTSTLLASWKIWTPIIDHVSNMEPRKYLGLGKDSERLDFYFPHSSSGELRYWIDEKNIVFHGIDSPTVHSLPELVVVPETFRNSTVVIGDQRNVVKTLVARISQLASEKAALGLDFHLALSGGQTSVLLFKELAVAMSQWERVHIWMVDERCDGSNFDLLERHLLAKVHQIRYKHVHPMPVEGDCQDGGDMLYEQSIAKVVPSNIFDFVVLGLGIDGHTASLFPNQPSLDESSRLVLMSNTGSSSGTPERMTLTFRTVNAASNVAVLVIGSEKNSILHTISELPHADWKKYPILGIKPSHGLLTWYIDYSAMFGSTM